MPRRHVVKDLSGEEFDFVIRRIIDGDTDREISVAFNAEFDKTLAKSSLNRWRKAAGDELAERYRLARFQANQLLEDLKEEKDANKFQVVMSSIEDRLLAATREVIAKDPVKLLQIRQEEERRRLKELEIGLKRDQLELDREKLRGAQIDRVALGEEFSRDLLEFIDDDPTGLRWFTGNVKKFNEFLRQKHGASEV